MAGHPYTECPAIKSHNIFLLKDELPGNLLPFRCCPCYPVCSLETSPVHIALAVWLKLDIGSLFMVDELIESKVSHLRSHVPAEQT